MRKCKITTLEMEIALMEYLDVRRNTIVPNVSWGMELNNKPLHECDLLVLSKAGFAVEIEIKISKADLLKDKEKKHKHSHNLIKFLTFAVPENLRELALKEIPKTAGLYVVERWRHYNGYTVRNIRGAVQNKDAVRWNMEQRMKLLRLGAMRSLTLKKQVLKEKKKLLKIKEEYEKND